MGTYTPIRSFYKPDVGETGWGLLVNAIFNEIDGDIDFEGKCKVWPSGGISFANTPGGHSDPGDDVMRIFQGYLDVTNLNVFGQLRIQTGASFFGEYETITLATPGVPTAAEIASLFGSPDTARMAIMEDDAGPDLYLVISSSVSWFYTQLTEAV